MCMMTDRLTVKNITILYWIIKTTGNLILKSDQNTKYLGKYVKISFILAKKITQKRFRRADISNYREASLLTRMKTFIISETPK